METNVQQGHVGGVVVIDPSTAPDGHWGYDTLSSVINERLHLLPPFRRRLVEVPLDIDYPYWIEDPHFDLGYHLRHIAVPAPGDDRQLANLVARIHERPLDRTQTALGDVPDRGPRRRPDRHLHEAPPRHDRRARRRRHPERAPRCQADRPRDRTRRPMEVWELRDPSPCPSSCSGEAFVNTLKSPGEDRSGRPTSWSSMNPFIKAPVGASRSSLDSATTTTSSSRPSLISPRTQLNAPDHPTPAMGLRRRAPREGETDQERTTAPRSTTSCSPPVRRCGAASGSPTIMSSCRAGRSRPSYPISVRKIDQQDFGNRVSGMIVGIGHPHRGSR